MRRIAIIGGGFSGTMVAVNLIRQAQSSLEIFLINNKYPVAKGIAYSSYSDRHTLNVMAGRMSAFPDEPMHFVNWLREENFFDDFDNDILSKIYVPRNIYGKYLSSIYDQAKREKSDNISFHEIEGEVINVTRKGCYEIELQSSKRWDVDSVVLAVGNFLPSHPTSISKSLLGNLKRYFQNPWTKDSISIEKKKSDILIIGNGLTMVDTVIGLLEAGHYGRIYSISNNGFAILPHRHNGITYPNLLQEVKEPYSLRTLVSLFNKHVKQIRNLGLSAEPVIDSLRPLTQKIWISLTFQEKRIFMSRLRHLWGVARHRLPIHVYDQIIKLKLDKRLVVLSGRILDITEEESGLNVKYFNKTNSEVEEIYVDRAINCTGPNTNVEKEESKLLFNLLENRLIQAHEMGFGVKASPDGRVFQANGELSETLYAIGNLMKGELWESTAVPELRQSAKSIATSILTQNQVKIKIS